MNIDLKKNTNQDFTLTCAECFILISRLSVVFWMLNTFTLSKSDPEEHVNFFLNYMIKRIEPTNLDNIKRKFRELLYADVHPEETNDFFYELVYYF